MLTGSLVALVTPMDADGQINYSALRKLVDWHIEQGTDGLVAVGTTGESPTVSVDEHIEIVKTVVEQAAGRVPVIAGTGANSTREAIILSERALAVGANFGLSVVPYYNKPSQQGLYLHFKAIAENSKLPTILYNVPGRTVCDLANDTALKLAELPNIVGIKDATGNMERAADMMLRAPKDFAFYSGDDASTLPFILLGGHGTISVTANIAPKSMHEMCKAALSGDIATAKSINDRLQALHKHLFIEANPIPVKWALEEMGMIPAGIRLPLTRLADGAQATVRQAIQQAGVL
ncbi:MULTISPECIES: 4-hydroxy-tetrahydrodipicolinate synthase [Deefgea]|uniref:4-hydroxy-tetrahydrodipicolinate synthase n=1 Tax=Deefgea chitinilytica TaxID=570276 RepID=A0ABS2C9P0_9NEIS|nr:MULTISPECIES: 4-hydroxy-tetrahydrodipicolinate synthase [Deefgea]MBM5570757.1 4-hydroxy-tetrahydrodipicolinate synthase [Deefgea chitinilytica]MBM9887986.1 4-hydroxy-tetrahydrodipicolinate synthase [Deefgea sp. CFH1-16]